MSSAEEARRADLSGMPVLAEKWADLVANEGARMRHADGRLDADLLREFRRRSVFVSDHYPYTDYANLHPRYWWRRWLREPRVGTRAWLVERVSGALRGERRILRDAVDLLESEGGRDLLERYATREHAGHPRLFHHRGYKVNRRFIRHLYFLNLIRNHLGDRLDGSGAVCLDLGSSYGSMSSLVFSQFTGTHHVLVDFADQLRLAEYFLGQTHPSAKIELCDDEARISRDRIEATDFTLVPVERFDAIEAGAVDLFSNYLSLGEMTKEWFDHYMSSDLFRGVDMFVTSNRFVSGPRLEPTYPVGLTFMDYPLGEFETLLLDVNPISTRLAEARWKVLAAERHASSQYFDFVGVRRR